MRSKSLYGRRKADGQTQTVVTNFGGGVDEYTAPIAIGDNQLSSGLDYISRDGISLKHWKETDTTDKYTFSGTGVMTTWNGTASGLFPLLASIATPFHATVIDGTAADYSVASYNFISKPETTGALEFITQAETYSIYWSTDMNIIIVQAQSSRTLSTVTLPTNVYPRDMVAHKARLFLIDTHNTLWWCNAGDYTTWYGETPTEEYVSLDAGYWFVDAYDTINRICVFRDNLYVFGDSTIYVFSGFSDTSFALQRMFVGIGTYAYSYRSLTADSTYMYFTYKGKVYRYDGSSSMPVVISEPVISDGKYVNGISSGVKPWNETYYNATTSILSVYVDEDYLYWYPFYNVYVAEMNSGTTYPIKMRIGVFDTKRGTWWKISGFSATYNFLVGGATGSHQYLFPAPEASGTYWGIGTHTSQAAAQTPYNRVLKMPPWVSTEWFYTKAFARKPSESMVLTDVYIVCRTTSDNTLASYQDAHVDVQVVESNMDTTFVDSNDTLYFKTFQLYGMSDFNIGFPVPSYTNMFVTLHVPLSNSMNTMYQGQGEGADPGDTSDGFWDTTSASDETVPSFFPSNYLKLMIRSYSDPGFEIHRMELKYRVKGASR